MDVNATQTWKEIYKFLFILSFTLQIKVKGYRYESFIWLLFYITIYPVLSCPIMSYTILSYPVLLSYPVPLSYPAQSCLILSCPILSYPVLSCPILSYPVLSCPILSYSVLSCPILPYPVLSSSILWKNAFIRNSMQLNPLKYHFYVKIFLWKCRKTQTILSIVRKYRQKLNHSSLKV